jgi:hypothetical protein
VSNLFSEARLLLKQVDLSAVGELERHALSTALLAYGLAEDDDEIERGTSELRRATGAVDVQFDPTRARRFAGDSTLPRSRYYSLADDDFGFDDRTLLREMSAYLVGSTYPGLVSFFDTAGANTMELLAILAEVPDQNTRSLDLAMPSLLVALRPLASDSMLQDAYGKGDQYVVQIPYTLLVETIENVIDLRRPAARAWLVERFASDFELDGKRFPVLLHREPLVEFSQLLPSLLDQWLGGGWSTGNMTGYFAREARAGGLVYPSARSNAFVEVEHDIVTESSGWCFVRYADAPEMETGAVVGMASDPWPTTAGYSPQTASWVEKFIPIKDAQIEYERSGSRAGSFWVTGLAEYNLAVYRLSQAVSVMKSIDNELGSKVGGRLNQMALSSAAKDIAWIGLVILCGLLGDAASIARLELAAEEARSEFEQETLVAVQTLVARSPRNFATAGPLARALTVS